MIRIAPVTIFLAGAIMLAPIAPAFAISSEEAPAAPDGSAGIADPDEQLDEMANPDSGTGGSATIEVPPIEIPGADSDDYLSPDADDDPAQDPPAPQDQPAN